MPINNEVIFTEINNKVGLITLNRPEALNALTISMCHLIDEQLADWEKNPAIKAVMIQGSGEKAFCAGGDIRRIYELGRQGKFMEALAFFQIEYQMNARIFHYKKPYIAFLNGITMGGGMGLSMHGKYRIGTEKLLMAMPETGIGFFPDVGGSHFLSRCGALGTFLGLTGHRISAQEAAFVGLIDYIVPSDTCQDMIHQVAGLADFSNQAIEEVFQCFVMQQQENILAEQSALLTSIFSADTIEEIMSALAGSSSDFILGIHRELLRKSPTSLKVTLEQLSRGVHLDIDACLAMEYQMVQAFLSAHDFYEGIRALLIDKDKKPHWEPDTLAGVSNQMVLGYF